jgi:hypothetical protein
MCKSKDSTYYDFVFGNRRCGFCSQTCFAYFCPGCNVSLSLEKDKICETCVDAHHEHLTLTEKEVHVPTPRKRSGTVRLFDKHTGKPRTVRLSKYFEQTRDKRYNNASKNNFRRIKYGYDERHDLGEIDKVGNFSYEDRTCSSWQQEYGVVPLNKREREHANRTNGHLVHQRFSCKCCRFMWTIDFPNHKAAHMNTVDQCAFCPQHYTLDEHGHSLMDRC